MAMMIMETVNIMQNLHTPLAEHNLQVISNTSRWAMGRNRIKARRVNTTAREGGRTKLLLKAIFRESILDEVKLLLKILKKHWHKKFGTLGTKENQ